MGRRAKRRNANLTHTSFDELRASSGIFDLTTANLKTRGKSGHAGRQNPSEITIVVSEYDTSRERKNSVSIILSVRKDVTEMIKNRCGERFACGVVRQNGSERFYMVPNEEGYLLSDKASGSRSRAYLRIMVDKSESNEIKSFSGDHKLLYDEYNNAYYVLRDR